MRSKKRKPLVEKTLKFEKSPELNFYGETFKIPENRKKRKLTFLEKTKYDSINRDFNLPIPNTYPSTHIKKLQKEIIKESYDYHSLKESLLKETPLIKVNKKFNNKVKRYCKENHAIEWSGIVFYDVNGTIENPKNFIITPLDILFMDKGTVGSTEYEFDMRVVKFIEAKKERKKYKIGHIHSHNNMPVFFSATDAEELIDNSKTHNYYLSIIVNNINNYKAKIGINSKTKQVAMNEKGEEYLLKTSEIFNNYNCKIRK